MSGDLLESLPPEHAERLREVAITLQLQPGALLLRRGEPGGDLYRLATGTLEVLDARMEPPVVLAVVGPGAVLGEMAFLDGRSRSADVRAAEPCTCQLWNRDDLMAILDAEPALGRSFYRALADLVTSRSRNVRAVALHADGRGADAESRLVGALRRRLLAAEIGLRTDPAAARRAVVDALDTFHEGFRQTMGRTPATAREAVGDAIGEQVRPWWIRSHLAELATSAPSGRTDDPTVLGHVLDNEADGDGELGRCLDAWLLDRPTCHALRDRAAAALRALRDTDGRVAVVNGGACVPEGDVVRIEGPTLGAWVLGEQPLEAPPEACAAVVLDALLDSLPDRLAARVLTEALAWVAPGGLLVATGLAPTDDADLFTHLLQWPQVRREPGWTGRLVEASGWADVRCEGDRGLVITARRPGL